MATPPKPDSRLDDWNGIGPAVDITTASLHGDPIRASVRLAWSRAGLHLAVQAHDVKHCQQYSGRMMWAEDSIQLAFDADPLRPSPRGIFEFGLCGIGSRATLSPRLFAYHTPDGAGCGPRREPAAVRREAATTVYELTLPWPSLGVKEPQAGQVFGLSLLVNDADAPGGREFAAWFGGIATHKDPDRFGFVVLGQSNETGESPR